MKASPRPRFALLAMLIIASVCAAGTPSTARADTIQAVALPWQCTPLWAPLGLCRADAALERAFELEYWARIGQTDVAGMRNLLGRLGDYVNASKTPRAARLSTLVSAGYVMVYRSHSLFDVTGLPLLLDALAWAEKAHALAPGSPNTGCFYYFLRAYRQFGLLDWNGGMASVDTLLSFPQRYGAEGSEGEVVGAMALGLLTDVSQAERTLDILADCTTANCRRTTVLAPFKLVGMHMAIAESYGKVGDLAGMEASLERARDAAAELGFPWPERIDELEDELTRAGGLLDAWAKGNQSIGYVRLPLPPSAGVTACSNCHINNQLK